MKKRIRITENTLYKIIRKCINESLQKERGEYTEFDEDTPFCDDDYSYKYEKKRDIPQWIKDEEDNLEDLNESKINRIVKNTVRDYLNEWRSMDKGFSYAEKEGSLVNLCNKLISNDAELLRQQGSLADMKEFIIDETQKLKGTSDMQKDRFLHGEKGRSYDGILGSKNIKQLFIRLSNVALGDLGIKRSGAFL